MKQTFVKKHPILTSIGYLLILTVFTSVATSVAQVIKATETQTMLILSIGFILSTMVAIVIMLKSQHSMKGYGICLPVERNMRKLWIYLPFVLSETIPMIFLGFDKSISIIYMITILIYISSAVIHEEIYFRGLILKTLSVKGTRFAITLSAIIFGVAHLGSLIVGKDLSLVLLLIAYAILFGFVVAQIAIKTGSILFPILLHFVHNLISIITVETSLIKAIIIVGIQFIVLIIYAIYFWISYKPNKAGYATGNQKHINDIL